MELVYFCTQILSFAVINVCVGTRHKGAHGCGHCVGADGTDFARRQTGACYRHAGAALHHYVVSAVGGGTLWH